MKLGLILVTAFLVTGCGETHSHDSKVQMEQGDYFLSHPTKDSSTVQEVRNAGFTCDTPIELRTRPSSRSSFENRTSTSTLICEEGKYQLVLHLKDLKNVHYTVNKKRR